MSQNNSVNELTFIIGVTASNQPGRLYEHLPFMLMAYDGKTNPFILGYRYLKTFPSIEGSDDKNTSRSTIQFKNAINNVAIQSLFECFQAHDFERKTMFGQLITEKVFLQGTEQTISSPEHAVAKAATLNKISKYPKDYRNLNPEIFEWHKFSIPESLLKEAIQNHHNHINNY